QVQVVGLDGAEVAFEPGQALAGGHGAGGVERFRGNGGADDVDPVGGRLGVDAGLVPAPGDLLLADVQGDVPGHLPLGQHLPGAQPDRGGIPDPPGSDLGGDLGQVVFGRGEQVFALAGALGGQDRVAAGDQ